jgi:ComEC/Rec2-related protein
MNFPPMLSEGWNNLRSQLHHRPLLWTILAFVGGMLGFDLTACVVVVCVAALLRSFRGLIGGLIGCILGLLIVLPGPAPMVTEPGFKSAVAEVITIPRTQEQGFSGGVRVGAQKFLVVWQEDWGVSLGDEIKAEGWVKPFSEGSEEYLTKKGYSGLWTIKTRPDIEKKGSEIWRTSLLMRKSLVETTSKMVPAQDQALVDSMCFNHYAGLDQDTNDAFGYSGLKHLMAASGSTVLIICGVLMLLLRALPLPRWACVVVTIVVLGMYVGAASLTAAAVRSVLMLLVVFLAEWVRRPYDAISTLSLVAIVALLLDPTSLLDAGFQISYACSLGYGIVVQQPRAQEAGLIHRLGLSVWDAVRMSGYGWLLSTPILAHHFHYVALGGVPGTLLALVPYTILVSAVFGGWIASGLGLSMLLPWLGWGVTPCISALRWIADTMSHPALTIPVYGFSVWWLVIGYGTFFLVWAVRTHPRGGERGVRSVPGSGEAAEAEPKA